MTAVLTPGLDPELAAKTGALVELLPWLRRMNGAVVVLKRSMASGFAGIDNPLFYDPKTSLLFGDAKASVGEITSEVEDL